MSNIAIGVEYLKIFDYSFRCQFSSVELNYSIVYSARGRTENWWTRIKSVIISQHSSLRCFHRSRSLSLSLTRPGLTTRSITNRQSIELLCFYANCIKCRSAYLSSTTYRRASEYKRMHLCFRLVTRQKWSDASWEITKIHREKSG